MTTQKAKRDGGGGLFMCVCSMIKFLKNDLFVVGTINQVLYRQINYFHKKADVRHSNTKNTFLICVNIFINMFF